MWKRLLLIRGAELLMFAVLAAVPLAVHNPYVLGLLTLLAIYGILLIGLDVTVGYLGQVNLAQAAFLASAPTPRAFASPSSAGECRSRPWRPSPSALSWGACSPCPHCGSKDRSSPLPP